MKVIKKLEIVCLIFIVILTLVGCEFTSSDFSVICDDSNTNCNQYDCDYDDDACNGSGSSSGGEQTSSSGGEQTSSNNYHPQIDPSSVGKAIADYAENLYKYRNKEFRYISPSAAGADKARINTYNNVKTNGYLYTDCNGFVGYVIHMSAEIGPKTATKVSDVKFAYPIERGGYWASNHKNVKVIAKNLTLNQALSQAVRGDLIASNGDGSSHIRIYIGDGKVIENRNANENAPISKCCKSGCDRPISHANGKFTILTVEL